MTRPYRVLLTTACFEPGHRAGGPIKSVARIIDTASDQVSITALTGDRDLGVAEPYPGLSGRWVRRGNAEIHYLDKARLGHWLNLLRSLRRYRFDLLYCNSLWEPHFSVLPIVAARLRMISVRDVLVAPRGELSAGALRLKNRKKSLFLKLWRPLLASSRVRWHASTAMEAADIRKVWPDASIEIVEDQTDLPPEPVRPERRRAEPFRAVFIGRISPMKNLLLTLDALARCAQAIDFEIFGPIEDQAYWTRCQKVIAAMPANVTVRYAGPLDAGAVRGAFAGKDAFLFPSLGENFGHVVPESLSASCPVFASDRTPWTAILNGGGGVAIADITADKLARVVDRAAAMRPEERLGLRRRAAETYRVWRAAATNENILDRVRTCPAPAPQQRERTDQGSPAAPRNRQGTPR